METCITQIDSDCHTTYGDGDGYGDGNGNGYGNGKGDGC